jgi:hypothetical protein
VEQKQAESQGAYIDRLRTMYPFRIHTSGYDAVLTGIQPLNDGEHLPIYRFPGGPKVVFPDEIKNSDIVTILEW